MEICKSVTDEGKLVYNILNRNNEPIASFPTFTDAGLVLRYLKGGTIGKAESEQVISAMRAVDKRSS